MSPPPRIIISGSFPSPRRTPRTPEPTNIWRVLSIRPKQSKRSALNQPCWGQEEPRGHHPSLPSAQSRSEACRQALSAEGSAPQAPRDKTVEADSCLLMGSENYLVTFSQSTEMPSTFLWCPAFVITDQCPGEGVMLVDCTQAPRV